MTLKSLLFLGASLFFVAVLAACGQSHTPGGGGGGGGGDDAGVGDGGSGGGGSGGGGSGGGSGGGGSGGGGSGGGGELDLLSECIAACDHLSTCSPAWDRLECIESCLGIRDLIMDPECEAVVTEMFQCINGLSCAVIARSGGDFEGTECWFLLRDIELVCEEPPTSGGGGPMPVPEP
jgi:hypothetical protein